MQGLADLLADADDDMLFVEDEVPPAEDHKRRNAEPSLRPARAHEPERGTKRDREQGTSETAQLDDPIAAAQSYRQRTAAEGTRRYECHLCLQLFQNGHARAQRAPGQQGRHEAQCSPRADVCKQGHL